MTAPAKENGEIETMRRTAHLTDVVLQINVDGVTHEESLIQPRPAGNCLNWVVGHLVTIYGKILPMLGQEQVRSDEALARYDRGSRPMLDGREAIDFNELLAAWRETAQRVDAGLAALPDGFLDLPAPVSPNNDPNETMRSLIGTILFHQAYHSGQTGILRRTVGKEGAIA